MALEGRFGEHHAMMCRLHLDHIAYLEKTTAELDARIEAMMQPFRAARDLLTTIPGIGAVAVTTPRASTHCEMPELATRKMGTPYSAARTAATRACISC